MNQNQNLFTNNEKALLLNLLKQHIKMVKSVLGQSPQDSQDKIKSFYRLEDYISIVQKIEDNHA